MSIGNESYMVIAEVDGHQVVINESWTDLTKWAKNWANKEGIKSYRVITFDTVADAGGPTECPEHWVTLEEYDDGYRECRYDECTLFPKRPECECGWGDNRCTIHEEELVE